MRRLDTFWLASRAGGVKEVQCLVRSLAIEVDLFGKLAAAEKGVE